MKSHRFNLIHCPATGIPHFTDARYGSLTATPPPGCVPSHWDMYFSLRCRRPGETLLDAVAPVCAEVRAEHGVLMTDLGVEGLWEWSCDGQDGHGAAIVAQLLLMAADRGQQLGYSVDDLLRFLRTAAG
ncbi:amidase [Streptomyces sp. NPDC087850]|uniref:amidase n=1 Tax=Streptomyces sp. NPDC087850 TaxID=3365809 RepID=UPI0037FD619E